LNETTNACVLKYVPSGGGTLVIPLKTGIQQNQQPRHLPYIHARYQGEEAAIAIEDGSVFDGGLGVGRQW
jgi:hypothetical protein